MLHDYPGWNPRTAKEHWLETKEIWWALLNNTNQYCFINSNKCTILIENVDNKGNWVQDIREYYVLTSQFFYKSNTGLSYTEVTK